MKQKKAKFVMGFVIAAFAFVLTQETAVAAYDYTDIRGYTVKITGNRQSTTYNLNMEIYGLMSKEDETGKHLTVKYDYEGYIMPGQMSSFGGIDFTIPTTLGVYKYYILIDAEDDDGTYNGGKVFSISTRTTETPKGTIHMPMMFWKNNHITVTINNTTHTVNVTILKQPTTEKK